MTLALPSGYEGQSVGRVDGFVWSAAMPWMRSVLAEVGSLHDWAATAHGAERMSGRGTVYAVPAPTPGPDQRKRWAVRHYHRGGALASRLGDRYLRAGHTRPAKELWASVEARARGIDTPAVVAGAVYRSGAFYRADLVTEMIPEAIDLAEALFGKDTSYDGGEALAATGRLIGDLVGARVLHADLNAKNVLLVSEQGGLKAHVLDLDRCTVLSAHAPVPRDAMRRRLERSLRKLSREHRRSLTESHWETLAAASATVR